MKTKEELFLSIEIESLFELLDRMNGNDGYALYTEMLKNQEQSIEAPKGSFWREGMTLGELISKVPILDKLHTHYVDRIVDEIQRRERGEQETMQKQKEEGEHHEEVLPFATQFGFSFEELIVLNVFVESFYQLTKSDARAVYSKLTPAEFSVEEEICCEEKRLHKGELRDAEFIEKIVPKLGRNLIVNENKLYNKLMSGLYDCDSKRYAEVIECRELYANADKDEEFTKYNYNPQFTIDFNYLDYEKCADRYSDCDIYIHLNWEGWKTSLRKEYAHRNGIKIVPLEGVWVTTFRQMKERIEQGKVGSRHRGWHTRSYLFDLSDEIFTRLL